MHGDPARGSGTQQLRPVETWMRLESPPTPLWGARFVAQGMRPPALHVSVPRIPHDRARCCPALGPGDPTDPRPTAVWHRVSAAAGLCGGHVARVASPWQLGGKRVRGSEAWASFSVAHSDHVLSGGGFPGLTGAVYVDLFLPVAGRGLWPPRHTCLLRGLSFGQHYPLHPHTPGFGLQVQMLAPALLSEFRELPCLALPPTCASTAPHALPSKVCTPQTTCLGST